MHDYAFPRSEPSKSNWGKWLVVIIFFVVLALGFWKRNALTKNSAEVVSPLPTDQTSLAGKVLSLFSQNKGKDSSQLLEEIKTQTDKQTGTYSVYIYDLKTNQSFGINENTIYTAASINKIPILASLYFLAAKNEVDLDQQVTLQAADIQDYGTGSIRYDPPGTTYSVKTLARLMMEKSDNTAAYILGRGVINFDKIQELVNSWGLTQTDMAGNKTSLVDMTKLLIKMYHGEITSPALNSEMLGFMDDSDFEDRIPALLPKDTKIYHKTGDGEGEIHDVGIIELPGHPFALGIFSTDINDVTTAKATIARITKMVFDWEKSN